LEFIVHKQSIMLIQTYWVRFKDLGSLR